MRQAIVFALLFTITGILPAYQRVVVLEEAYQEG